MSAGSLPTVHGVLEVARRQHHIITAEQLEQLGAGPATRMVWCQSGWLRRIRHGIYAVAGAGESRWTSAVAALLSAGPIDETIALSHSTAAAIHRIAHLVPQDTVELTVVAPRHPRLPGAIVHRVRQPLGGAVTLVNNMPVTTPGRTLLDISPRLSEPLLGRVVDEGRLSRLWTITELRDLVDRGGRGRRRNTGLVRLLEQRSDERVADSPLEGRLLAALRPLAPFQVHHQISLEGHLMELDVAWPELMVGVEADGFEVHVVSRVKFDQDRRKANLLLAHGWAVAHITSTMSDKEMFLAAARLMPRWATLGRGAPTVG
jgi:Transcriptional regulator, AbiEi antitoxin